MSAIPSRACDCCNRRKVKCDRGAPCTSCARSDLICTYAAIPRKRGPKGPAARRIYALKQDQLRASYNGVESLFAAFKFPPAHHQLPSPDAAVFEPHPMLTPVAVQVCIELFFQSMYPIMPILHRETVLASLGALEHDAELYALVASLCAMTAIQLLAVPGDHDRISPLSETLISEALRARKHTDYIGQPTVHTVLTSFFLFCSYGNLEQHNHAWYYLRESISFAQTLGLDDEKTYLSLPSPDSQQRRRIFWLLFITERAYALQRHKPLSLHSSISLPPTTDPTVPPALLFNFATLATLFRTVDHTFVNLWNSHQTSHLPDGWLNTLHEQLQSTIPMIEDTVRIQKADILVSQQWLHLLVWQLSLAKGCLTSKAPAESMTLQFPATIAKAVLDVTSRVSPTDLEAHGIGMQEKIYDIGCALLDVIICVPGAEGMMEVGPRHCLNELVKVLGSLRGGNSRYLKELVAKVESGGMVGLGRGVSVGWEEESEEGDDGLMEGGRGAEW